MTDKQGIDRGQNENSEGKYDRIFKLLVVGDCDVGKTSLMLRYTTDAFTPDSVSTVGVDFKLKTIFKNGRRIKLQIWDTAGQERFRTITTAYFRGAVGIVLMYDIANEESFRALQEWSAQIKQHAAESTQVILVGNKSDIEKDRVVPTSKGSELAEQLGFLFLEASSVLNHNVSQVFEQLVDAICQQTTVTVATPSAKLTDSQPALRPAHSCSC
ncbi:hypothetical protein AGOR_G00047010 [Albula goreensis]|uniref:small monomeric GTPase n=1 Tax=Albula goreensis TaxID=1534307 RepID=A0A8T3DW16_9TELE|nr:hypothetical protein AGOR_G00047010 [Albula goreensis]